MRKSRESGFALLLVFLMAAVIAISLYMEIPRVAFQSQRQKEQLLMERGHQYTRAIQLFVKANGRYPAELKDLENFNNRRFLRHKFVDPMTGKDDWRLIHINNGVLTDSILTKQKQNNQQPTTNPNNYVSELPALGSMPAPGQQNMSSPMTRRRPSDGGLPMQAVGPDGQLLPPGQEPAPANMPPPPQPGQSVSAMQPFPGFPGAPPTANQPQTINQPQAAAFPGIQPVLAGQGLPGVVPQVNPGMPAYQSPGAPVPPELANQTGTLTPGQPFQTRTPYPGQMTGTTGAIQTNGQPSSTPQSAYVGGSQPYIGSQTYIGGTTQPTQPNTNPVANSNPFFNNSAANNNPVANSDPGAAGQPTRPVFPGMLGIPGVPAGVGSPPPSTPAIPPGQSGAMSPPMMPVQPPPQSGTSGSDSAANMINNLLTTPRTAPVTGGQPMGQQMGGGIAGIASKSENPSIMVYNDRSKYNEWEFIYDYTKQQQVQNPGGGLVGTPASALGTSPTGTGLGTPAAALGSSPSIPGFGGAAASTGSAFGLSGFGGATAAPGAAQPGFGTAAGSLPAAGTPSTGGAANPAAPGAVKQSPFPPGFRFGRP